MVFRHDRAPKGRAVPLSEGERERVLPDQVLGQTPGRLRAFGQDVRARLSHKQTLPHQKLKRRILCHKKVRMAARFLT